MNEVRIDLKDASVARMIKLAKVRGYVTRKELSDILPPDEFTSDHVEDVVRQLLEMGIAIVEN